MSQFIDRALELARLAAVEHLTMHIKEYGDGSKLRDEFAGQAMQAFCIAEQDWDYKHTAKSAYEMADAMLAARKLTPSPESK